MGTAMYRPWVCRAKLGGERSVSPSERSVAAPSLSVSAGPAELGIGIIVRSDASLTTCESQP